jgi:hypothetical protein
MGSHTTPRYILNITCSDHRRYSPIIWNVRTQYGARGFGKPTLSNINKWVTGFESSLKPGNPNAHLGEFVVIEAWIIDQIDDKIIVHWKREPLDSFDKMS